jgi:2-hydroxy-3-keto-5-methylthiopentenyl-1-phosphate phosphatase
VDYLVEQTAGIEKLLISDFDGTITAVDFFQRVLEQLYGQEYPDYWDQYVRGEITHFEALNGIFGELRVGHERLLQIAESVGLEESFAADVERLYDAGWGVIVVSAGSQWYIQRLFERRGVGLPIVSNPGEISSNGSLQMRLDHTSPFFCREIGVDKAAVVRWGLDRFSEVAFAGDGRPDVRAAELVSAGKRFARGWLAEYFSSQRKAFVPFSRWSQVVDGILTKQDP